MMSMTRRPLKAAVCGLVFAALAGTASAQSLNEAIAQAYASNPSLQQQRALLRATDEGYVQAKSVMGPSARLNASVNGSDVPAAGTRATTSVSIGASQTLFASGRLSAGLNAAEAEVMAGREDLRSAEAQLIQNVISTYTAVRRDMESLRIRQENVSVLRRQLEESKARFEVGEITRTDVAQSEARLAQAQAALSAAEAQLSASRAQYTAVVGEAPGSLSDVAPLNGVPASFDAAMDVAEAQNPQLLAAQFAEAASRARVAQARAGFGPSVELEASYGASAPTSRFKNLDERDSFRTGVSVSVPLYTSGLNSSRLRAALEQNNAAKLAVDARRRTVVQQVSQAFSNLQAQKSARKANEEQVRATRIAADGVRQEAQVGLRTTLDVLNAEQELRNAELALVQAVRDEYVASADLLAAMGQLEAGKLVSTVEVYSPQQNFDRVKNRGGLPLEPVVRAVDSLVDTSKAAN